MKSKHSTHFSLLTPLTLLTLLTFLLPSCQGRKAETAASLVTDSLRYATNITCQRAEGYSIWTLRDPWDTTHILNRYILVSDTAAKPDASLLTSHIPLIHVPVRRAGVATAVHCGLIDELHCGSAIAGVCEKQYIELPIVTSGLADGTIADFGNGMNPNVERIMDVAPDVLLLTPFEHSGGYGRVERLGIPIVECAEYMETSPLARAEWIRFYGELFGAQDIADSIFRAVEHDYTGLRDSVKHSLNGDTERGHAPTLLTEMLYGGQWFVPCANSTMGIMFADAGADYLFSDLPGSGSTALAFETVLDRAHDADVWLLKYNSDTPLTYEQLAKDYQPYTRFRAWQQRHIYVCDLAHNHFYEQTPFHPERLLRDYVAILHPGLLPNHRPRYYRPMSNDGQE